MTIVEMREKRAKLWATMEGFLDTHRNDKGVLSAEDDATYVGIKATIIANEDVTEDEAYAIVSTIFEGKDAITEAHAKGADLDLEYASTCGLPYHAGAAKYFAEKGIAMETK